jgi:hypothetical protein
MVGTGPVMVSSCVACTGHIPLISNKDRAIIDAAGKIFEQIDYDGEGSISKLDLIDAVQGNRMVDDFVLPGISSSKVMRDDTCFDAIDTLFGAMSNGRRRVRKHTFVRYFRKAASGGIIEDSEIREMFDGIESDSTGSFSRLALMEAVPRDCVLADILLPGEDCRDIMNNTHCFDALDEVFDEMARGGAQATFADFNTYIRMHQASAHHVRRRNKRVLIIGLGFGDSHPRLREKVRDAGYVVSWVSDLPEPMRGAPMEIYSKELTRIKTMIDEFQPHLIVCASKGGQYIEGLWQSGLWHGPTLMINAQPNLHELPKNIPIVVAHGSNNTCYRRSRESLEQLMYTGSANMCFLFYTANSGRSSSGQCSRIGDSHHMESLLVYDCLPRLMDAAMSQQCPEAHMLWSSQQRLAQERLNAERWLSYCPTKLRQHWESTGHKGMDNQKLYEVSPGSQEFDAVTTVFFSAPKETSAYIGAPGLWQRTKVTKVERIENGLLERGAADPYYESLRRSIEEQGIQFEDGVHTRWAFHGTDAVESIIMDPLMGFQPLTSGTRLGTLWGSGTYFARDARYVVESSFCSCKKMLLCLVMTGIPCLGDPDQHGVLPFRQKPHRYNSAVDSLANPEIFVVHHPGAAYPAYLISFS